MNQMQLSELGFIDYFVLSFFILICFSGIFVYDSSYNLVNVKVLLEFFVVFLFLIIRKRLDFFCIVILFFSIFYVVVGFLFSESSVVFNFYDFLLIFKSFIYVSISCFFLKKNIFSFKMIHVLYRIVLLFIFFKYAFWLLLSISSRPGLFGENNYELLLLISLYICDSFIRQNRKFDIWLLILLLDILMSRSLSAALAFGLIFILLNRRTINIFLYVLFFSLMCFWILFVLFYKADGDFQSIDRYIFYLAFIDQVRDWSVWSWLIGSDFITPLRSDICARLSFYETLFSYVSPSICYSNVFQSYILKTIYDHGVIISFLLYIYIYMVVFRRCKLKSYALAFLLLALVSSLSISGPNSVFFFVGLLFFISLQEINKDEIFY